MVNLMTKEQIAGLTPEGRLKNAYESLYYRTGSGDPEMDEILRMELQQSFKSYDVLLADQPEPEQLKMVMLHAFKESTKELQRAELSEEQSATIEQGFASMSEKPHFFKTTFESFERRHQGEPIDFAADYARMVRDNGGIAPHEMDVSDEIIEHMQEEFQNRHAEEQARDAIGKRPEPAKPTPRSGLSYGASVPEAVHSPVKRAYQQVRQEEAAAAEQKAESGHDPKYDAYAREKSQSKFTAGDSYGFDERDEPEDDGPEL